ncbi:hypothetical protein O181_121395 [Austropuccinia psidii MF-1]|uniref:Integrase catalytic domain-containing protein n=1 Tax=Austropuccinia psidii MF-1 TaxID=1389203 RepID=A0A9Q3KM66_9BASI|nr:hypothetical protein [Austropuccinia psidii MF-1]
MFHSKEVFSSLSETSSINISTGDPASQPSAEGVGSVSIIVNNKPLNLSECLYVPKLKCNLISLLQLCGNQITITRDSDSFDLTTNEKTFLHGKIINNLMKVEFTQPKSLVATVVDDLWHKRLGHPGKAPVCAMGLPSHNLPCHTCNRNKIHQLPFKDQFEHHKLEAFDCFLKVKNLIENQHDRRFKNLVSDHSGEFLNENFKCLASDSGFFHTFSPLYTPQHNGFAERANRTILDKSKCLLNGCGCEPVRYV